MANAPLNILIIDDHQLFIDGLAQILVTLPNDISVQGATSAEQALAILDRQPAMDWIFLDLNMPGTSGLQLLGQFKKRMLAVPVVVVSSAEDPEQLQRAIDLGVSGFVPKTVSAGVFHEAMQIIEDGGRYIHAEHARLLQGFNEHMQSEARRVEGFLSARLRHVLELMGQGHGNREIANALALTESTVKSHVSALLSAFQVRNRTQCIVQARRLGFID